MTSPEKPLDARLDLVPQNPGVYLMKDAAGSVIYVGKAVNLRNRLRSYFTAQPQGTPKVLAMISHIADFSTIVCSNETEALMLESTLIKKHQPLYNILLRDDRDYPYLRITMHELYPRVLKAYRIGDDRQKGAHYYGPYLAGELKRALESLRSIFPMKTCRRVLPRDIGKERPCLNYYIGRCIGPCKGDVPADAYREVMDDICKFLEGRYDGILSNLEQKMNEAAEEMQYETAALHRDRMQALEQLIKRQKVVSNKHEFIDVIGLAQNGNEFCLQKMEIRDGRLVASAAFFFAEDGQDQAEIIHAFILQHYPDMQLIPEEILLPVSLPGKNGLEVWLRQLRQGRCLLHVPQRGVKNEWQLMAQVNARESLHRHTLLGGSSQTALQEALRLLSALAAGNEALHRIEAIDISNTGEHDYAASLVVFQEGRPLRQQYRHYRISPETGSDDYAATQEVLRRRLARLNTAEFGSRPDLILLDGGKGHVSAGTAVLAEMNLRIPLAGMVKDRRHRTRGLVLADGQIVELRTDEAYNIGQSSTASWLRLADENGEEDRIKQDNPDPLDQPRQMALLRLLTAVQDEAHRFAGDYRKKLQNKRTTRFSLEQIDGVGPARRRALLRQFQTIKNVSLAEIEQLQAVPGMGDKAAEAVFKHFHPEE